MIQERHFSGEKFLLLLACLIFLFPVDSRADSTDIPSLFSTVTANAKAVKVVSSDSATVSVAFSLLRPSSIHTLIRAALPGKTVILSRKSVENRGADNYSWFGRAEGDNLSTAVLTVVRGVMYGHIDINGDSYEIRPDGANYTISKMNPADAVPLIDDTMVPNLPRSEASLPVARAASEDGSQVDVLALYTQQMQTKYGSGIGAKIQSYADLANDAYSNSGISTHLRLVGTVLYPASGAAEGTSSGNALNFITNDPTTEELREQYGADLVSLLRVFNNTGGCGTSWVMTPATSLFEPYAYSVVETGSYGSVYCDNRTFAHELGHNMGCQHDRAHATDPGAYSYSYGYGFNGQFGTVMSYISPVITYFSTPQKTYNGTPVGMEDSDPNSADNAHTINNTKSIVANFMPPKSIVCSYTISPSSKSFSSAGGTGTISVTSASGCSWTASTSSSWVTVTHASDTGSGTVNYTVAANTGSNERTANITVAGNTFVVTQDGVCSYTISPSSESFSSAGGNGTVSVTSGSGCSWTASTSSSWISVTPAGGNGNGTVEYAISPNTSINPRTGYVTIAGKTHTVTQMGQEPSMEVPSDVEVISSYAGISSPADDSDFHLAKPVAFGDIADGGDVLSLQVGMYKCTAPVDIYLLFTASYDPQTYYMVTEGDVVQVFSGELLPWKRNTGSPVNASLFGDIQKSLLRPGTYTVYLGLTPAGDISLDSYYLWSTSFTAE